MWYKKSVTHGKKIPQVTLYIYPILISSFCFFEPYKETYSQTCFETKFHSFSVKSLQSFTVLTPQKIGYKMFSMELFIWIEKPRFWPSKHKQMQRFPFTSVFIPVKITLELGNNFSFAMILNFWLGWFGSQSNNTKVGINF